MLGLHCRVGFAWGEWGLLSSCGVRASHCGSFSCGTQALGCLGFSSCGPHALEHRLSSCGVWAYLLRGMWDPPGPGIEPTSPALAGGLFTTEPPGKPPDGEFMRMFRKVWGPWETLCYCWEQLFWYTARSNSTPVWEAWHVPLSPGVVTCYTSPSSQTSVQWQMKGEKVQLPASPHCLCCPRHKAPCLVFPLLLEKVLIHLGHSHPQEVHVFRHQGI